MSIKLIAKKYKMSHVFCKDGKVIPITILKVMPNYIIQIKNKNIDNYDSIQIGSFEKKKSLLKKSEIGHFNKANIHVCKTLSELRFKDNMNMSKFILGDKIDLSCLKVGNFINVRGKSKGKGFAGVIKKHNFSSQRMSHGNSLSHRVPGSIGQCQTPGKVFKGKKMPGRLGNSNITIKKLLIVKIYLEHNLIFVKGGVPGYNGSIVFILSI